MKIFIFSLIILMLPFLSFSIVPMEELEIGEGVSTNVSEEKEEVLEEESSPGAVSDVIKKDSAPAIKTVREKIANFEEVRQQRMIEAQNRKKEVQMRAEEIREQKMTETRKRQEVFKDKVKEIREEQLRNRVERLSENINRVNQNLSNRYNGLIGAMEIVLDKLESRTAKAEEETGKDLSSIYLKIKEARAAIEIIREEIAVQKSKVYVVDISSEENLGTDFQKTIQEMRADHQLLRSKVHNNVRELIKETVLELKTLIE